MTTVVAGYYGMRNFGDDLFRAAVEQNAASLWPNEGVRFVAPRPDQSGAIAELYSRPTMSGASLRAAATAAGLARGRRLAYCGGSIFQDVRGVRNLHRLAGRVGWTRLEALGVSVGPFASEQARIRVEAFMSRFERVVVRDWASHRLLEATGIESRMGGDLAALVAPSDRQPSLSSDLDPILIAPCATAGAYTEEYELGVRHLVDKLTQRTARKVIILTLNAHPVLGDAPVAKRLGHSLRASGSAVELASYGELGLQRTSAMLQSAHVVVATRLHAGIVAYLAGVPVVFVAYHQKTVDFADDIQLGESAVVLPASPVEAWDAATDSLDQRPSFPATEYRARAQMAYIGSGRHA